MLPGAGSVFRASFIRFMEDILSAMLAATRALAATNSLKTSLASEKSSFTSPILFLSWLSMTWKKQNIYMQYKRCYVSQNHYSSKYVLCFCVIAGQFVFLFTCTSKLYGLGRLTCSSSGCSLLCSSSWISADL